MHPILESRTRFGAYMLAWVPLAALVSAASPLGQTSLPAALATGIVTVGSAALLFLSSFYICRSIPLKDAHTPQIIGTYLGAALAMSSVWLLSFWGLFRVLAFVSKSAFASLHFPLTLPFVSKYLAIGMIGYTQSVVLHYLLITHREKQEAENRSRELQILARETELKISRTQLNPHFLFNSLTSISALTTTDPKKARSMCVLLSDLLRKSLKLGEKSSVRLSEELDLIKQYLTIEQIRFGKRLEVVMELDSFLENASLPTMLLQPLVENAIKHGIGQILDGGTLKIHTLRNVDFVEVRIENPVDPSTTCQADLGIGLRQVRERLKNRFENRCYFEASIRNGHYEVVLGFPMEIE